jgi:hypothetical protein
MLLKKSGYDLPLLISKGDYLLYPLDCNGSNLTAFSKGTTICVLLIEWVRGVSYLL